MRKRNGKGCNHYPKRGTEKPLKLGLTKAELERGMEIGARVDNEKRPTMLIYYREGKAPE